MNDADDIGWCGFRGNDASEPTIVVDDDDVVTDQLPPCSELSQSDLDFGVACNNGTVVEEIRLRDSLFERLFRQLWSDTQTKMNEEAAVNGMVIDPLDVDAQLPEPIEEHQSSGFYTVDIKMSGMKVYGLSGINLTETEVTRSENLTDFDMRLTFSFDELVINGTYNLKVTAALALLV